MKEGRKRFFFEKKKQKTFAKLGHWLFQQHGLKERRFFCFAARDGYFVHKKEVLTSNV